MLRHLRSSTTPPRVQPHREGSRCGRAEADNEMEMTMLNDTSKDGTLPDCRARQTGQPTWVCGNEQAGESHAASNGLHGFFIKQVDARQVVNGHSRHGSVACVGMGLIEQSAGLMPFGEKIPGTPPLCGTTRFSAARDHARHKQDLSGNRQQSGHHCPEAATSIPTHQADAPQACEAATPGKAVKFPVDI